MDYAIKVLKGLAKEIEGMSRLDSEGHDWARGILYAINTIRVVNRNSTKAASTKRLR